MNILSTEQQSKFIVQDNLVFGQADHATYQITQWRHSIDVDIEGKSQYRTRYRID